MQNRRQQAGQLMNHVNSANVIRRVLVASISGSLPDEFREEAVNLLVDAMNAPDDDVRGLAVIALSEIGGGAPMTLPALMSAIHDGSEMVRKRSARALGELGMAAMPALNHLTAGLQDESKAVRLECAAALARIGPDAEAAIPALFSLLVEPDIRVFTVVSAAIRRMGEPAVAYAISMLADPDVDMRVRASELLGQIGCLDDHIVEALLEASIDREAEVREAARQSLLRLEERAT
jgi:HEAT repeat protein